MTTLASLKVLDLTSRLPGPLGLNLLAKEGAKVTKLEWTDSPDPFFKGDSEGDPIFKHWYDQFNSNKEIKRVEFESFDKKELDNYDIIVYSPKKRYQNFFNDNHRRIEVLGGKSPKYLHDLNALALSKSFNLSSGELPHLPFAGILYGQQIALKALSMLLDPSKYFLKVYLSDISHDILDMFWSESLPADKKHLHNGKFPCYQIYRSADKKLIAFAAVEAKFWQKFCELFNLNLELADRFDTSNKVKNIINKRFQELDLFEIKELLKDEDICITYLPH